MHGDHRDAEQPRYRSECLVESGSEQPTVGKAGGTLMVLGHLQLGVDRAAFASGQREVKPGRMVGSATETLPVVAAEGRTRRRCVNVAGRGHRMGRRLDGTPAHGLLGHVRTLPARWAPVGCHPGAVPHDVSLHHRERLWPPWWAWLVATGWALTLAIAYGSAVSCRSERGSVSAAFCAGSSRTWAGFGAVTVD